jgi:acyl-CoA synthetase (AMP-forming)/AMP-acid ligase II
VEVVVLFARHSRLALQPGALIRHALADHGLKIVNAYAGTEYGPGTALETDKAKEKWKSVGVPFLYIDVRVVDEQGLDVKPGQVGEVVVKGPGVVRGYWKNPEATTEAIVNGWLHTGDLARLDEEGYLYIVDRKKDTIISGGEKIYPIEVENLLLAHPKVADAAVVGEPDEIWGENVTAVVQLKPGETMTDGEILDFCRGRLARYEMPKRIIYTNDALPRNVGGKLMRRLLREQLNQRKRTS